MSYGPQKCATIIFTTTLQMWTHFRNPFTATFSDELQKRLEKSTEMQ